MNIPEDADRACPHGRWSGWCQACSDDAACAATTGMSEQWREIVLLFMFSVQSIVLVEAITIFRPDWLWWAPWLVTIPCVCLLVWFGIVRYLLQRRRHG